MNSGAVISSCTQHRYKLWRTWNPYLSKIMFIMLNPSTADGEIDDATIRRCIGYSKSWGYGGLYVGNLFSYRATNPKELLKVDNPVGEFNDYYLNEMKNTCDKIIYAWGNSPIISKLLGKNYKPELNKTSYYLDLCKDGTPKHPLYLKKDLIPKKFKDEKN